MLNSIRIKEEISQLRKILEKAVKLNLPDGILFSGGLDTSILLSLATDINPEIKVITVSLESYGEDLKYAKNLISKLKIKEYYHRIVSVDEAIASVPTVINILKSFDPAIPNDLVIYFGLKLAKENGSKSVMTGDGADELFGGYSYMQKIKDLDSYSRQLTKSMYFNSNILGEFLGLKIKQPYLDKELVDLSGNLPIRYKIREEDGKVYGKWILRKAFEDRLPFDIIWQEKRPIEYGSGMTRLREIISTKISDEDFKRKKDTYYPIKFLNKEHLFYYEIFHKLGCSIPHPKQGERSCPGCGSGLKTDTFHCKICGYVLMSFKVIS